MGWSDKSAGKNEENRAQEDYNRTGCFGNIHFTHGVLAGMMIFGSIIILRVANLIIFFKIYGIYCVKM